MLALYRCGRQAAALEVYRDGRRGMVEELGLEPGPALRELQEKILDQSADLDLRPPPRVRGRMAREQSRPTRRRSSPDGGDGVRLLWSSVAARCCWPCPHWPHCRLAAAVHRAVGVRRSSRSQLGRGAGRTHRQAGFRAPAARPPDCPASDGEHGVGGDGRLGLVDRRHARTRSILREVPLRITPDAMAVGARAGWVANGRRGELVASRSATPTRRTRSSSGADRSRGRVRRPHRWRSGPVPYGSPTGRRGSCASTRPRAP